MTHQRLALGTWGEDQVVDYLKKKGFKVLRRNWVTPVGEIDVLARHRQTLLFIEVKTRRSVHFGTPAEAVGARKQRQIIRAAQWILMEDRSLGKLAPRFDVISVIADADGRARLDHIENAFSLEDAN